MKPYALLLACLSLCVTAGVFAGVCLFLGALDRLSPYPPNNNTYFIGDY